MSSFLQKLRGKGVVEEESVDESDTSATPEGVTQLPVDVYQSDNEIIIYAQIPGTDISKLDVSIEGDNDVITVQGEQHRPEELARNAAHEQNTDEGSSEGGVAIHVGARSTSDALGEFSIEECAWGQFFRQVILPQEVDPSHASAKVKDGVLVLHLPLKEPNDNRIKMKVVKLDNE